MAEDTRIMVPLLDDKGVEQERIYSATGEKRSKADFEQALATYQDTGQAPPGFTVLKAGTLSNLLRKGFETVNQPVQSALRSVGGAVGHDLAPTGFAALAEHLGLVQPGTARSVEETGQNVGEAVGRTVGETFNTPQRAGMTAGLMAAAPFLGPTATLTGGLNKAGLLGNMLLSGAAGAGTGALAQVATGDTPDLGKTGVEFGLAAAGAGLQGVVSHFLTRYVPQRMQEEVAGNIIDSMANKYPQLKNDPHILDYAASNSENLSRISQTMASGLRGTVKDVTDNLLSDVNNALPKSAKLTVGDQNTFRARIRNLVKAGNDMLDNITDSAEAAKARSLFDQAKQSVGEFIEDHINNTLGKNMGSYPAQVNIQKINDILSQHSADLAKFNEGATVLSYLKQSGQGEGFNPMAFRNAIIGAPRQPGSLLSQVGQDLAGGPGQSLANLPNVQESINNPDATVINFLKKYVPGGQLLNHIPIGKTTVNTPVLPWQRPVTTSAPFNFGAQQTLQTMRRNIKEFNEGEK